MTEEAVPTQPEVIDLSDLVLQHEWSLYQDLLEAAAWQKLPYCLGGGLAFSAYSKRSRGMKDVDLFVQESDRQAWVDLLTAVGYEDFYDREPYDRSWIYRGYLNKVVLDIIWTLPNHRVQVDYEWFQRGQRASVYGHHFILIPPEDMVRAKLFVMQHDRCDWPDLLNILEHQGPDFDWDHLIDRTHPDERLLGGLMSVFAWMCPAVACQIPARVWARLGLLPPSECETNEDRASLLDTRDWFGPGRSDANELYHR